jgi:hypothetical protein
MAVLFVLALLLAWPTFGLSLVAWLILGFFKSKSKAIKADRRSSVLQAISPLFGERYAEFYEALNVPRLVFEAPSKDEAYQCGRLIVSYIAHNPSETALLLEGLKLRTLHGNSNLWDPVDAVKCEAQHSAMGNIQLISYRAIETLMTQNNLPCFRYVSLPEVQLKILLAHL